VVAPLSDEGYCGPCETIRRKLALESARAKNEKEWIEYQEWKEARQRANAEGPSVIEMVPEVEIMPNGSAIVTNVDRKIGYLDEEGEAPADGRAVAGRFKAKIREEAVENMRRWRGAPWIYVREVLSAAPDAWQDECLHALIESGFQKFALKACKGPGKSCLLAWVILWFLTCFENPKVVCTSITGDNLRDGLWTEISLWRNKSELLKALLEIQSDRIYAKEAKETWFATARTWPKDADKTQQANTLAGIHARNTMVVVDEAGDIPDGVVVAALAHHSTQEPGTVETHLTLIAGNPTRTDGPLWNACTRDSATWWVKEITGDPKDPNRAPRIDMKWAQDQIDTWGADNPWVLVNVFGKFPPIADNKLLGPDIVRKAMEVYIAPATWQNEPRVMGVDVARSLNSDASALCRRQGACVYPFRTWRIPDLMQLCGQLVLEYSKWKADKVFIDVCGMGGGVVDRLRELGLPVVGVDSGAGPADKRFADKRTEMWWAMHLEVKGNSERPRLALPKSAELLAEITAPTTHFNDRGKLKLESKEAMKKRGIPSPNMADALAFTYSEPVFMAREALPASIAHEARISGVGTLISEYDPYSISSVESAYAEA
jgi:hypothetical protein